MLNRHTGHNISDEGKCFFCYTNVIKYCSFVLNNEIQKMCITCCDNFWQYSSAIKAAKLLENAKKKTQGIYYLL